MEEYPTGAKDFSLTAKERSLNEWLTEGNEVMDRIENHLTNLGEIPCVPQSPIVAQLGEPTLFTRASELVNRLRTVEGALARMAYTLGGKVGGQR